MGTLKGDSETYIYTSIYISKEEIEKLKKLKLPIYFYDCKEAYYDEVGGYHDCAEGWNPNGVWCGECTRPSCKGCPSERVENNEDK